MEITIKIKLDNGREVEFSERELIELRAKLQMMPLIGPQFPIVWPTYSLPVICRTGTAVFHGNFNQT